MPLAGDKISLTVPTPGGDTDVWGTILNALFAQIDEIMYAAREDRNQVFLGGGKMSWDGADFTFTSGIDIHGHISAFKNSVTTAASPVSIPSTDDIAYATIAREPASDTSTAIVNVVAAGALPNTDDDDDSAHIVLAYRSADSTLILPWCRKELLSGDHWQFGSAQTWYERIASHSKPWFHNNTADTSQLSVPGSATSPSVVLIDGKIYANVSDESMDLDVSGRGGLDTGAKAAGTGYYLYAIPSLSGRTFDLVCSLAAPGTGPTGFTSWSYLGSFVTVASSAIPDFIFTNGRMIMPASSNNHELTVNNASPAIIKTFTACPTTAKAVIFRSSWTAVNAVGDGFNIGSVNDQLTKHRATSTTVGNNSFVVHEIPVLTAQSVYANVTTVTTDAVVMRMLGWVEDPMEWR